MTSINFNSNGTFSGPVYAVDGVTITGSANVVDGTFALGIQGGLDEADSTVNRGETIVFTFDSGAATDVSYNLNFYGDGPDYGDNDSILGEATIEAFGVNGNSLGTVEQVGTFDSINVSQLFGGVAISKFQITGIDIFGIQQLSFTPATLNNLPTATNDTNTTNENNAVTGNVLTNDTDPNAGDTLSVAAVNGIAADVGNQITLASGALLTLNSNGTYSYNPNGKFESLGAGQTGRDSFTYTVSDGKGGTSNATVTVNITGVNDAPTGSPTPIFAVGIEDTPYTINAASLLQGFTDVDSGDTLSVSNLTATNGALVNNNNGTYTFTPNANYNGVVNLSYSVVDGNGGSIAATESFSLAAVNDAPTGSPTPIFAVGIEDTPYTINAASLLQGFTDVDSGDTLSVSNLTATNGALVNNNNGTYTFTPNANYNGVVNLSYSVVDGNGGSIAATESFSLAAVNDTPIAVNDSTTANQNTALNILTSTLIANDSDIDNPNSDLRITGVNGASGGTAVLNNNGTASNFADDFITFTPTNGFSGNGSFNYTLSDGSLSSSATVQVVVGKNINGGNGNDNLTGTAGNDVINGLNGQDTLSGLGGNDRIDGGNGDDKLYGGDGKDTLIGGNGNDQLAGDAGDDLLDGGRGNDTVTGGSGSDIFALGKSNGIDTIIDFSLGQGDKIGLLNGLTFNQLTFSGNQILAGGEILGVLSGFNTNTLTAANFVSISESMI